MKDATGELSMTVVVIIAVIAILAILTAFLLPKMRGFINNSWTNMEKASQTESSQQT